MENFHDYSFFYKQNNMYCGSINLLNFTQNHKSPCYLYNHDAIKHYFNIINNEIKINNKLICYAIKACSNINIIQKLSSLGCGADCVSGGEIFRSIKAGISSDKIIFSGCGKMEYDIKYAIENDILQINVESSFELESINNIAKSLGKCQNISIRIRPNTSTTTHKYISTGDKDSKFGINSNDINEDFLKHILKFKNINLIGFSMHIGSQIFKINEYKNAYYVMKNILKLAQKNGINIKTIDFGGGFGVKYKNDDETFNFQQYSSFIAEEFSEFIEQNIKIIFEPGRFLVANSGILIAQILSIKESENQKFIILNAGMNDLIRVSMYQAYHDILPIVKNDNILEYNICGTICESSDFFAKNRSIPMVKNGDFVAIMSSGAYGSSMSSEYNSRPLIAEYLIENEKINKIRKERTWQELVENEVNVNW